MLPEMTTRVCLAFFAVTISFQLALLWETVTSSSSPVTAQAEDICLWPQYYQRKQLP